MYYEIETAEEKFAFAREKLFFDNYGNIYRLKASKKKYIIINIIFIIELEFEND